MAMLLHPTALQSVALAYYGIFGSLGDAVLLAACTLWKRGLPGFAAFLNSTGHIWLPASLVVAVTLAVLKTVQLRSQVGSQPSWTGPDRPLLFPCQTTHTRLFPKKHSFDYSYLLVGVPVGWSGVAGSMISTDGQEQSGKGWFHIDPADYLERGKCHLGLRGKLDEYLDSQGVDASRYPYAYLVTAAKFLGYHFNPVSFWYLYTAERELAAVVLEVNNTFDERRMYYLEPGNNAPRRLDGTDDGSGTANVAHTVDARNSGPLRQTWSKDFHVSPFNSRKGNYSLVAHDPLGPNMESRGSINMTISLGSSKGHTKLVARVFSEGEAIDPESMTVPQMTAFLFRWWWVGFVTFPRIVKEAAALFFRRELHVWYRPEPRKESMGRHADVTERRLEPIFRRYLRYLVKQSPAALIVTYVPSGVPDAPFEDMYSPGAEKDPGVAERTDIRVLTPAFYSRFVHYAHDLEALFCELNESCTISMSNPQVLPRIVFKKPSPPLRSASCINFGYFSAIRYLRQRPERIERPLTSSQAVSKSSQKDIRGFRLSSMDGYVLEHEDSETITQYRGLVLKLFISDCIALGSADILWAEGLVLRMLLAWATLS
ncbi:hypothetical protein GGR56DRAFT_586101 [Xylariaceae sp. FL0804]|nr:hypothetical protein GGR56DRAFT_586101 [Xylariaceae sp. FL0804]